MPSRFYTVRKYQIRDTRSQDHAIEDKRHDADTSDDLEKAMDDDDTGECRNQRAQTKVGPDHASLSSNSISPCAEASTMIGADIRKE